MITSSWSKFYRNSLCLALLGAAVASPIQAQALDTSSDFEPGLAEIASVSEDLPAPVEDGDAGLTFCHTKKWSETCLLGLMIYRCGQYVFPMTPYGCSTAAAAFVEALDLKRIPVTGDDGTVYELPVIFTKRLAKLIQNPLVHDELRGLRAKLEYAGKEKKKFDLWQWAITMQNGNREKALEWLAVLLQDTSPIQIQVAYLDILAKEGKFSSETLAAIDHLSEVAHYLSYENLKTVEYKNWLRLYPQANNLNSDLSPQIYHFYPMGYLAIRLKKTGFSSRLSSFLPFLFNTEYELQSLDPEMWPLHHPRSEKVDLNLSTVRAALRDMYSGMSGALFGIDKVANAPSLHLFQTDYAKKPFKTTKRYFWSFPSP